MTPLNLGSTALVAKEEEVFRRECLDLAFSRFRVEAPLSPKQVERAMSLVHSGAMHDFIERFAPAEQPDSGGKMYIDAKPFLLPSENSDVVWGE